MTTVDHQERRIEEIRRRFASLTGISDVQTELEQAGLETFLRFCVGRDTPLYRRALARINQELPDDDPFRGSLSLRAEGRKEVLTSKEIELLRSLITRSLRVTSDKAQESPVIEFVSFPGGEEHRAIQPTNHAILGRRGVGKSSLILMAHRRIQQDGNIPIWIDLQAYRARNESTAALEIIYEIFQEAKTLAETLEGVDVDALDQAKADTARALAAGTPEMSFDKVRQLLPQLRQRTQAFTRTAKRQLFVFIDDAHVLGSNLQPQLFDLLHSILKGAGGWLKIAGVKNLLRLYEPSTRTGLQHPNDVQLISLDLTLVDPSAARDHLTAVLNQFLVPCGFKRSQEVIADRAIDRLVWCSAGVPRDFLSLFDRSLGFATHHRRKQVGVQDVNLAVGEFGQQKMADLEEDTSQEGVALRNSLDRLQKETLDHHKSNSFLIHLDTKHQGYSYLQKLVDLRLIHLIHPSITVRKPGERYEAYLLDYSFYTGVRRRVGLSELKITPNEPPKYAMLRKLPRIELDTFLPNQ